jgi:hypothetical protein
VTACALAIAFHRLFEARNWAKCPVIKRFLVGSLTEVEVSYLRTFALRLGTEIGFGTQSRPMAATSPSERQTRVRLDGGVSAASCSAPMNHDVGGLSERRAPAQSHQAQGRSMRRLARAPTARPLRASAPPWRRRSQPHREQKRHMALGWRPHQQQRSTGHGFALEAARRLTPRSRRISGVTSLDLSISKRGRSFLSAERGRRPLSASGR